MTSGSSLSRFNADICVCHSCRACLIYGVCGKSDFNWLLVGQRAKELCIVHYLGCCLHENCNHDRWVVETLPKLFKRLSDNVPVENPNIRDVVRHQFYFFCFAVARSFSYNTMCRILSAVKLFWIQSQPISKLRHMHQVDISLYVFRLRFVKSLVALQNVLGSSCENGETRVEGQIHKDFRLWITIRVDDCRLIPGTYIPLSVAGNHWTYTPRLPVSVGLEKLPNKLMYSSRQSVLVVSEKCNALNPDEW